MDFGKLNDYFVGVSAKVFTDGDRSHLPHILITEEMQRAFFGYAGCSFDLRFVHFDREGHIYRHIRGLGRYDCTKDKSRLSIQLCNGESLEAVHQIDQCKVLILVKKKSGELMVISICEDGFADQSSRIGQFFDIKIGEDALSSRNLENDNRELTATDTWLLDDLGVKVIHSDAYEAKIEAGVNEYIDQFGLVFPRP